MESFRSGDLLFLSCVFHFPLSTIAAGALRRLLLFFLFHCSIVPPHFYSYQLFFFFFFIYPIFPFFNGTLEQKRKTMFIFMDISCLIVVPVPFHFCSTLLFRYNVEHDSSPFAAIFTTTHRKTFSSEEKKYFLRTGKMFPTRRKMTVARKDYVPSGGACCRFRRSVLSLQSER